MTKTSEGMSLRAVIWGESSFQDLYKSDAVLGNDSYNKTAI